MKRLASLCILSLIALPLFADTVELMARYVITTSKINQLTGAVTGESRDNKLMRAKLKIAKHTQDGQVYLAFTSPAGEGNDVSEESVAVVLFEKQPEVLATLKAALAKMLKAANNPKAGESSEVLWSPNDNLALTLCTQVKVPKSFVELRVDQQVYVLRNAAEFEKLIAAVKAVK